MTNVRQIEDNKKVTADAVKSSSSFDGIATNVLHDKEVSKARVRITAYQARILMDGITPILDDIDKNIIEAAQKNLDEISYKLSEQFTRNPYYTEIKASLENRGFNVYVQRNNNEAVVMLRIKWVLPQ